MTIEETPSVSSSLSKEALRNIAVSDPETSGLLDDINLKLLYDLYAQDLLKVPELQTSGQDSVSAPPMTREDIILIDSAGAKKIGMPKGSVMAFHPTTRSILVDIDELRRIERDYPEGSKALHILRLLTHEIGHSLDMAKETQDGNTIHFQVGLQHIMIPEVGEGHVLWDLLYEAVNEKRAMEKTRTYIHSSGEREIYGNNYDSLLTPHESPFQETSHLIGIHIVEEIIKRIAKDVGLGENTDAVWHVLLHAKHTGLDLRDKNTIRTLDLDSLFGHGFTKDLSVLTLETAPFFLKKYNLITPEFMHRISLNS